MATVLISNLPTITDATSVKGTDDLIINTGDVGSHNTMSLSFDLFKTALFQLPTQIGADITVNGTVTAQTVVVSAGFQGDLVGDVVGDVTGTVSDLSNHTTDDLAEGPSGNRLYLNETNLSLIAAGDGTGQHPGFSIGEFKDVDTAAQAEGFLLISRGGTFVCEDSLQFASAVDVGTIVVGPNLQTQINTVDGKVGVGGTDKTGASADLSTVTAELRADLGIQPVESPGASAFSLLSQTNTILTAHGERLDDLEAISAFSGDYGDLTNTPTLGTASAEDIGYFATASQGGNGDAAYSQVAALQTQTTGRFRSD